MTSDDQQFLDLLASIPQDAASYGVRYASAVADFVEKQSDTLASKVRENLNVEIFSDLVPEFLRQEPVKNAPKLFRRAPPPPPQSALGKVFAWISANRTPVACAVAFYCTVFYLMRRNRKHHARKRRARRSANGAKKEIVILATSFHDVLARSVAFDLERRGHIVYITVSSPEEEQLVHGENNPDIQPLWMDLTSTPNQGKDIHPNFLSVHNLITPIHSPSSSSAAVGGNSLVLSGLILLPSTTYPSGHLSTISPSSVIDTINTHLISPFLILQQYLPLHYAAARLHPLSPPPRILVAAPSIASSLPTASDALESALPTTLRSLIPVLRQELSTSSAPNTSVINIRLGNFDLSHVLPNTSPSPRSRPNKTHMPSRTVSPPSPTSHTNAQLSLPWHSSHFRHPHAHSVALPYPAPPDNNTNNRSVFPFPLPFSLPLPSLNTFSTTAASSLSSLRVSPVRDLHNAIFDALAPPRDLRLFGKSEWKVPGRKEEVVFVGRGAWVYWVVGGLVPRGGGGGGGLGVFGWGFGGWRGGWGMGERDEGVEEGRNKDGNRRSRSRSRTLSGERVGLGLERGYGYGGGFGGGSGIGGESAVWEKV